MQGSTPEERERLRASLDGHMGETPRSVGGRPTAYSEEIADKVLDLVAEKRMNFRQIGKLPDMPTRSLLYRWCHEHPDFAYGYALAMQERTDMRGEEIIKIAKDGSRDYGPSEIEGEGATKLVEKPELIERSRLAIKTIQYIMEAELPRKYKPEIFLPRGVPMAPANGDNALMFDRAPTHPGPLLIDARPANVPPEPDPLQDVMDQMAKAISQPPPK